MVRARGQKRDWTRAPEAVWWLALAGVITLGLWWPFGASDHRADSFSTAASGTRAFFRLVSELMPFVEQRVSSRLTIDDDVDTICLLGPARYPSPVEWERLFDWVSDGGSLLFAGRLDDPAVDLGPFGVTVEPLEWESAPTGAPGRVETELVSDSVEWPTQGEVGFTEEYSVLVSTGGQPQAVVGAIGSGMVVVCASAAPFSNAVLGRGRNGELAFRLLEECRSQGLVVFEESLHASGPAVFRLLFAMPFRHFVLQLVLLLVLYWWRGWYRFGPALRPQEAARRNFAEHARGLARLYARSRDVRPLLRAQYEHFRRRLGFHLAVTPDLMARRAGLRVEEVTALLSVLAASTPLTPRQGAKYIRMIRRLDTRPEVPRSAVGAESTAAAAR